MGGSVVVVLLVDNGIAFGNCSLPLTSVRSITEYAVVVVSGVKCQFLKFLKLSLRLFSLLSSEEEALGSSSFSASPSSPELDNLENSVIFREEFCNLRKRFLAWKLKLEDSKLDLFGKSLLVTVNSLYDTYRTVSGDSFIKTFLNFSTLSSSVSRDDSGDDKISTTRGRSLPNRDFLLNGTILTSLKISLRGNSREYHSYLGTC